MDPREKLAADLELLKPVADHVAYWSCGLIAGQSLTIGDLRALLAEPKPTPMPPALRQVELALKQGTEIIDDIGRGADSASTAEGCGDASRFLHAALALLPALAQQMVEGEQAKIALVNLRARVFAIRQVDRADHSTACTIWGDNGQGGTREGFTEPLPCNCGALRKFAEMQRAKAEAELTRTREALAVAEENLESAAISLASYDQSYGGGGGESEALDIARSLGFDGNSSECVEWLLDRCKLRAARIAALSPTGTPGAKKGSPE